MVQKNDDDNCHDNNILMSDRRVDFGNFIRIKELLNSFKFLKSMLQPHYLQVNVNVLKYFQKYDDEQYL